MTTVTKSIKTIAKAIGILSLSASSAMAALPTSGTCGFIASIPNPAYNTATALASTVLYSDILGSIDFANKTISYNITTLYYDGANWKSGSVNGSSTYTVGTALSNPSGTYPISFSVSKTVSFSTDATTGLPVTASGNVTVSVNPVLNLLPTNSGNTILIQGGNLKTTGVCQMM